MGSEGRGGSIRARWLLAGIAALFFPSWFHGAANALATPATSAASPAIACDVTPRSPEDNTRLLAEPNVATPAAATAGQTLPAGTPATPAMSATIERIVRMWLACQNAGEPLRAWALFSDGYLYRLLSRQGALESIASPVATPRADEPGGARLLDIRGERVLPDGRFGATVTVTYPSVPMPKTFFFYFVEINGHLLIDGILGEISFSVP